MKMCMCMFACMLHVQYIILFYRASLMEYRQSLQVRFEKMKTPYNYTTMYILTECNLQESIEKLESEIQLLRTTHHSPSNRGGGGDSERVEGLTPNPLYIPHITLPVSTTILCTCVPQCTLYMYMHVQGNAWKESAYVGRSTEWYGILIERFHCNSIYIFLFHVISTVSQSGSTPTISSEVT